MAARDRILVVEDSLEVLDLWSRVLTRAGFAVIQAVDGADGVRRAQETQPDAIVMDMTMPVLDGLSAVRQLRASPATADIPVLIVSGDDMAGPAARAAGGDAFLPKPVRTSELLAALGELLREASGRAPRRPR